MSDLTDIDVDSPMTDAELRMVREFLGLTTRWLAEHFGVAERTVHRWESGDTPVPDDVREEMERLEAVTAATVTATIEALHDVRDVEIQTYRTDRDYRRHHPEQPWPASWHRAVVARVAQEVPGLVVTYWTPRDD